MKKIVFALLAFCLTSTSFVFASTPNALEGKTFVGTVGEIGSDAGDSDTFTFDNGKFDSVACHQYGFKDGEYAASDKAGAMAFEATTMNGTGSKIHWKGMVKENAIFGTATRQTANGKTAEMWFKGSLKN